MPDYKLLRALPAQPGQEAIVISPENCVQDMKDFKAAVASLVRRCGSLCSPFSLSHTPSLLHAFMAVIGNLVRVHMLACHLPYKQIIQLYSLVHATVVVISLNKSLNWLCMG